MLAHLEVRVWKADEDLGELVTGEEVGEEFHGVTADHRDVFVVTGNERRRGAVGDRLGS